MNWRLNHTVAHILAEHHYLGPTKRGISWLDDHGVITVAPPTARQLPTNWLELTRWCLVHRRKNDGSRQWAAFVRDLREARPDVTTIVSYSDPSAGHTGALYRACNWIWAPTWHRLRPPPTANGSWDGERPQAVKDRWVYCLRPDPGRVAILTIQDDAVLRRKPWARYSEPAGVPYKRFLEESKLCATGA